MARERAVEEGHNGSLQLSGGGALDVANKPLVGGQRRTKRATINSANISSRTNYTVQNLVSPFPTNGRLTDPRWRVRTERGGRSPSCARRPRAQLLSRIPSATRAFSMTCTKPSGARVSFWNTVWTNRGGEFVGVIPNSWPMPDQIAFCVCLIPLRGPNAPNPITFPPLFFQPEEKTWQI